MRLTTVFKKWHRAQFFMQGFRIDYFSQTLKECGLAARTANRINCLMARACVYARRDDDARWLNTLSEIVGRLSDTQVPPLLFVSRRALWFCDDAATDFRNDVWSARAAATAGSEAIGVSTYTRSADRKSIYDRCQTAAAARKSSVSLSPRRTVWEITLQMNVCWN
jgi:hypothetical protein